MPLFRSRRRAPVATTTRTTRTTSARKPSLFYRLTHSSRKTQYPVSTVGTSSRHGTRTTRRSRHAPMTTGVARKPTFGDKIHGMFYSPTTAVLLLGLYTDYIPGAAKVMAG